MPAHFLEPGHRAIEEPHVRPAAQVLHEIEAHCADPAVVHALEFLVAMTLVNDRRAAIFAIRSRDRIERHAHVRPMAARVYDDRPLDTENGMQPL